MQKALGHELPNQLIAVQGLARLLDTETERLSDDGKEYLQRLGAAAQRSHEMVRALADFLRALRAGKISLKESREFLKFYESGMEGYTYLEE